MATKGSTIEKVISVYQKWSNPLRYLSSVEIDRMLQQARFGCDEKLQLAFYEIERNSPIYSVCINKRLAGVANREWDVIPVDESKEAKNQAEVVKKLLLDCDMLNRDGLTEALRHLCMASFRGRSAIKPFFVDNHKLILKKLDNWNFISFNGHNYWNPKASSTVMIDNDGQSVMTGDGVVEIPDGEIAWIEEERPVDVPGLMVYLRSLIGEDNWARAVEKYGIAQVLLRAPEGTPDDELQMWNYRAQSIFEGASGCLPFNTGVDILTQARDQDPFSNYIQHQMELVAIMSTGSSLATLGGTSGATGSGMGSDLANTQNDQFTSLVNSDCKKISNAMSECVVKKCVQEIFGYGTEVKCRFTFVEQDDTTVNEYLEYANKAKALGLKIDVQELKRLTKLSFISDDEQDLWQPNDENNEVENK